MFVCFFLFIPITLVSSNSLRLDPYHGALLVIISKRNGKALCLFQNPGVDMLVRYCRPAPHVVVGKVLREHRFRHRQTINQTGTACKLATSQALSKVDPATSFSRTPTNLPILLARQNQIKPLLLHNQRVLCRSFQSTSATGTNFDRSCPFITFIAKHAFGGCVACVARIAAGVSSRSGPTPHSIPAKTIRT